VEGRIDQVGMRLELDSKSVAETVQIALSNSFYCFRQSLEKKRYAALNKWTEALESVHTAVVGKTATARGPDPGLEGFGLREEMWT
jgi:COP9 signalosome complex subunit 2